MIQSPGVSCNGRPDPSVLTGGTARVSSARRLSASATSTDSSTRAADMTRIAISTSTASASVVCLHRLLFSNPSAPPPSRTPSPSPAAYSLPLKNSIAVGPTVCASPMAPAFAALRINRTSASSPPGGALRIHTSASPLYPCGATPSANAARQYLCGERDRDRSVFGW